MVYRYDNIVSLGFFCNVASEIERLGYRDASYPFDWVTNRMSAVNELISNDFEDLIDPSKLALEELNKSFVVKHINYEFRFYHDFNCQMEIAEQCSKVKNKYLPRIERFRSLLDSNKRVLFVRYVYDQNEGNEIEKFIKIMDRFPCKYDLLLVKNDDTDFLNNCPRIIRLYSVLPDNGDSVKREFITKSPDILSFFQNSVKYNKIKRYSNYFFLYKKKIHNRKLKYGHKISEKCYKLFKKI